MSNNIAIKLTNEELSNLIKIKPDNITNEDFAHQIIKERVNFVSLENGFYYNFGNKELYNNNGKRILFSRKEKELFNYLLEISMKAKKAYVDIETIKLQIWKNADTSIFSIRNIIKSIRTKTFYEIIKNKSSSGYRINLYTLKINN